MTSTHIFLLSAFFLLSLLSLSFYSSLFLLLPCSNEAELDAIGDETDTVSVLTHHEEEENVNVGDDETMRKERWRRRRRGRRKSNQRQRTGLRGRELPNHQPFLSHPRLQAEEGRRQPPRKGPPRKRRKGSYESKEVATNSATAPSSTPSQPSAPRGGARGSGSERSGGSNGRAPAQVNRVAVATGSGAAPLDAAPLGFVGDGAEE